MSKRKTAAEKTKEELIFMLNSQIETERQVYQNLERNLSNSSARITLLSDLIDQLKG